MGEINIFLSPIEQTLSKKINDQLKASAFIERERRKKL